MKAATTLLIGELGTEEFDAIVESADMPVEAKVVDGLHFTESVNRCLPEVKTRWVALMDGSCMFLGGARLEMERILEARVADAVTPFVDGQAHWRPISPACVMLSTEYLRHLGGLDEELTLVGWEIALRSAILQRGGQVLALDRAHVLTRHDLARDEALGEGYYDQIRDYDVLSRRGLL